MTKLRIAIAVPGLPFMGDALERGSLGGSETAALCVARELVAEDCDVVVLTNAERAGTYDGVIYYPMSFFTQMLTTSPFDVCVVQRTPELFSSRLESKLNILWCHDLLMHRQANAMRGVMWNIDRVVVLSKFMREQYQDVGGLPESALYRTRNGIDLSAFEPYKDVERDPKKLIFTSRPERGLDILLTRIFPKLLERDPELRLHIAGYENPVEHLRPFYSAIHACMDELGDRVVRLGALSKAELYAEYASAGCLVYPTPGPLLKNFREVSCITAMEAMASGLPMVTSARGALPETLDPTAGVLVSGTPNDESYDERFCEAVMGVVGSEERRARMAKAGRARAQRLSWRGVARRWVRDFTDMIESQNYDEDRLARHLVRHSNIQLTRQLSGVDEKTRAWVDENFQFSKTPEAYAEQYAKIGETHTDMYQAGVKETRLQIMIDWFRKRRDEIKTVLDVGCGLGVYAIEISNACPWLSITGVDIDPKTIEWAERYREKYAKNPQNLMFMVGTESELPINPDPLDSGVTGFDCVMACEVLEHVEKPWKFIGKIERAVKPLGWIYMTVPYGPWEHVSYESYPHRCHLWEFEPTDFDDMLPDRKEFSLDYKAFAMSELTKEPLGHFFVFYRMAGEQPRPIDIGRKTRIQRPRETVSVNVIAGGKHAEETLHWCLRSVRPIADELLVGDCGMTEEARRIAEQYADRVVDTPDPTVHGFETPRNALLDESRSDWILWLDSDEKIVEPLNLLKYLRRSYYDGYSIRQHHFATDTSPSPDLPVRLFRRDSGCRFYGMIHEHPETGINKGPGVVLVVPDVNIAHVGYLTEDVRRVRFARNHPMMKADVEKYPDRLLQKHFIMRDNLLMAKWKIQASQGIVVPEAKALLEEVLALYREHFLGKQRYFQVDSLQYYTEALALLDVGVDVSFDIRAARGGHGDQMNGGTVARFADLEEAKTEINYLLDGKIRPLLQEYF